MSAVPTSTPVALRSRRPGPLLAAATAVAFAAEAFVAALWPANLSDHATGAGRISEALAGLGFLLAAATVLAFAPAARRLGRALFAPAVLGCGLVGIAQIDIAVRGQEWPESVVTVIVLAAWAGLVLAGVVGTRARVWPWWAATLLAVVVPALFFVPSPFNSVVIALAWAVTAAVTRPAGNRR
jgi:hypothetical protein